MLTALTSLLLDKPVASDIATTGEVTLRGAVLPVGGIKERYLQHTEQGFHHFVTR